MVREDDRATNLTVRVPRPLADRLDELAAGVNRSKSELVRYLLLKATDGELPAGWRDDADALRAARSTR